MSRHNASSLLNRQRPVDKPIVPSAGQLTLIWLEIPKRFIALKLNFEVKRFCTFQQEELRGDWFLYDLIRDDPANLVLRSGWEKCD
jgi:hypothetical protein